jgi:hypothetical protein
MKVLGLIGGLVLTAVLTAANAAGASQAAVWSQRALIVDLSNLPKRYTCDELWYKFADVLVAIGARPHQILPYSCDVRLGAVAYSPKVQLEFSIPSAVSGKDARLANLRVVPKVVRLEPGAPQHLETADCALLNQMRQTLLKAIGADVTGFRLACGAPSVSNPPFVLTVKTLVPVTQTPPVAAGARAANPGGPAGS